MLQVSVVTLHAAASLISLLLLLLLLMLLWYFLDNRGFLSNCLCGQWSDVWVKHIIYLALSVHIQGSAEQRGPLISYIPQSTMIISGPADRILEVLITHRQWGKIGEPLIYSLSLHISPTSSLMD